MRNIIEAGEMLSVNNGFKLNIRPVETADIPAIYAIEKNNFTDPWSEAMLEEYCGQAATAAGPVGQAPTLRRLALVAESSLKEPKDLAAGKRKIVHDCEKDETEAVNNGEKNILGFICMSVVTGEASVDDIAVSADCRGKGIGRMLLDAGLHECANYGVNDFTLEVRAGNKPAIKLYERAGFVCEGVRRGYYERPKEDALIYWKRE